MNRAQLKPYFNSTMKINKMHGKGVEFQEHTELYKFTINKKNRRGKESVRDEPGTKDLTMARNPNELRGQSRTGRGN